MVTTPVCMQLIVVALDYPHDVPCGGLWLGRSRDLRSHIVGVGPLNKSTSSQHSATQHLSTRFKVLVYICIRRNILIILSECSKAGQTCRKMMSTSRHSSVERARRILSSAVWTVPKPGCHAFARSHASDLCFVYSSTMAWSCNGHA